MSAPTPALLDDAELAALTVEADVHQPRERAVPCTGCGRSTWRYHARCTPCGAAVCNRCDPGNTPTALAARGLPAVTSDVEAD